MLLLKGSVFLFPCDELHEDQLIEVARGRVAIIVRCIYNYEGVGCGHEQNAAQAPHLSPPCVPRRSKPPCLRH